MNLRSAMYHFRIHAKDASVFGPAFLMHHVARWRKRDTVQVSVPGIGPVTVRPMDSDVHAIRQVFAGREYDFGKIRGGGRVRERYEAILAGGGTPVIVDAGANIGAATLWFKREFPAAHIVAVEPDPDNVALLRRNIGQASGVTIHAAAIGAEPGFVALSDPEYSWAVTTTRADGGGCPVVTMPQCFQSVERGVPFLAKVDIEGFESDLFASNVDWLDDVYAVMIEPHDWMLPGKRTSKTFQAAIGTRDFEIYLSGENLVYIR